MTPPRHIAIIMDGNTRWAQQRNLEPIEGHKRGVDALRTVVEYCAAQGVEYLTAFAFSSENWRRSEAEVSSLMNLFIDAIDQESGQLSDNQVALRFIGERGRFDQHLQQMMMDIEQQAPINTRMTLILALDYGGRQDITNGCRDIAKKVVQGICLPDDIDEAMLGASLSLADLPDPELCIRTSNEQRISNFLMWQLAYAELYFSPVLWPDFGADQMEQALDDFSRRSRRYGASSVEATQ